MRLVSQKSGQSFDTTFLHLHNYAEFLLREKLSDFVKAIWTFGFEANIPLLAFLTKYSDEELFQIGLESNQRLLTALANQSVTDYVQDAKTNWLKNQLTYVSRDQVLAQDITLVSLVRRKVFRNFLPFYTDDKERWLTIMEEVDQFTVYVDSIFMNAYIELQQEKIRFSERELKSREQQLRETQNLGKIGSFDWDPIEKKISHSPIFGEIFNSAGNNVADLEKFISHVHPDDRQKLTAALQESYKSGDFHCEYRYLTGSDEKYILVRGKVFFDNGKPIRMKGSVVDITEKQEIISKLEKSEAQNKKAQAIAQIGHWSWNVRTGGVEWSEELYRIHGVETGEAITFEKYLLIILEEDREGFAREVKEHMAKGKVEEQYYRIKTPSGQIKIIRTQGEIIYSPDGNPEYVVGTSQDVTKEFKLTEQLKEREQYLNQLNRSLAEKNEALISKNKELESFNFIASHDLQEPLRKIQIFCNRIITENDNQFSGMTLSYFDRIRGAAGRMQKLIDDFLAFSQTLNSPQIFEPVDLNQIVREAKNELQTRITEKDALVKHAALPVITAIRFQIKQLFINLISNSIKYSQLNERPVIEISSSVMQHDNGPMHQIIFADNGIGFEQKYSSKVFELFQRLHHKNQFSGTGIGLALCKKICANHNGTISVESEPMKGTMFIVQLPITNSHSF